MQTFNQSFNAEQSAVIGSHWDPYGSLGFIGLYLALLGSLVGFPHLVYVDPWCSSRKR